MSLEEPLQPLCLHRVCDGDDVIFLLFSNNKLFLDKKTSPNSYEFNTGRADATDVNGSDLTGLAKFPWYHLLLATVGPVVYSIFLIMRLFFFLK